MKQSSRLLYVMACCFFVFTACNKKNKINPGDSEILHQNEDQLTEVIIYDSFTPPVASRIYAYSSLASYEAIRFARPESNSITSHLNGFKSLPEPEKGKDYNYTLAASKAFFTVVHKIVFSIDSLKDYEDKLFLNFKNTLPDSTYHRSVQFGEAVGKAILKRAATDSYISSRGKPRYLGSENPGKWRPTPPDYLDGVEFCWGTMSAFVLDSAAFSISPPAPLDYSINPDSKYYKEVSDLYETAKNLTPEQKDIARYWDDNPFVIEHSGHMMFANKKITPGGHWMGIASIACKQAGLDEVNTARTYAITAVALFDSFINCWDLKYKYSTVRPVTVINENIDAKWQPLLQTPPFPEFPSGHSTITRAAATVLTQLFGDDFAFQDTSDLRYIGMKRNFKSFVQAADEASVSRFYGGIHYIHSLNVGSKEGQKVGEAVIKRLDLNKLTVSGK